MICSTVCWPSQRSTISRLGPFRRRTRSGMSSVRGCWVFSFKRQPGARRGKLWSSGVISNLSQFLCGLESARRRPSGIDVGKIEGVELGPEDVALGAQRGEGQILFRASARVFHDPRQGELGVLRSLRQAAGEIVQTSGEPWVVLAHAVHAESDELAREEFGQGRGNGFEVRARGCEIDVGLDCKTRGGKNAVTAERGLARQARSFHETQPLFYAARLSVVAIVIENALAPGEAKRGVFAARENGRVFDGDAALIVVTIESPGLKLAAREPAFVHEQVKRMRVMVALFSDHMKTSKELGLGEQRLFDVVVYGWGHRSNSIPS